MCLTPITLHRRIAGRSYINNVPCNNCLECVKDRQNSYIIRAVEEYRKRKGTLCFFTLTYSPEDLPMQEYEVMDYDTGEMSVEWTQTLHRADVSKWLKLFKQKYAKRKTPLDFGYMISGEYGPKTQRPHYHGLIFGLDQEKCNELMWRWKQEHGFVCFKFIPTLMSDIEKVSRYCAKYMVKNDSWKLVPEGAEKPRIMTTQFFGMPDEKRWKGMVRMYQAQDIIEYDPVNPKFESTQDMLRVVNEIIKRRYIAIGNGHKYKLPTYYRRKIFYHKVEGMERASAIQRMVTYNVQRNFDADRKRELHELATLYDIRDYGEAVDKYNAVREADLLLRAKRYEESDDRYMAKSVC